MAEQETLHNGDPVWNPHAHGLWKRFIENGDSPFIDQGAINRARSGLEVVGTCRDCGGDILVLPTQDPMKSGSHCAWTDFVCQDCGKETAAPDTKRLKRSSLHSHMPAGWWADRMTAVKSRATMRTS